MAGPGKNAVDGPGESFVAYLVEEFARGDLYPLGKIAKFEILRSQRFKAFEKGANSLGGYRKDPSL
jgi:hypothetical protein